jgi:hypothetical protein
MLESRKTFDLSIRNKVRNVIGMDQNDFLILFHLHFFLRQKNQALCLLKVHNNGI